MKAMRSGLFVLVCLVVICSFPPPSAGQYQDTTYTNWPSSPDWASLTNHLERVYSALTQKVALAGIGMTIEKPNLTEPFYTYESYATNIDELCQYFHEALFPLVPPHARSK